MKGFHTKKTVLLIISLICFALLPARAQDDTLLGRMEQLRQSYGVHFVYDASLQSVLGSTQARTAPAVALPLEEALRRTFDGTAVNWQLRGNSVVLKAAPVSVRARRVAVSGHITDAATGETLIGAGVLAGQDGAVTNEYGFYSLPLPAGRHQLRVAYIGYEQVTVELDLQRDTVLNFALKNSEELAAARIVSRKDAGLQSVYLGSVEVPLAQIRNTPALFGEADLVKTLQLLPGVQGGLEGFSGLYVRGGGPEENLILLDGVSVYNMDHILGLFSIFQPEAVKNVTLFKGAFPSRYGGRISSIVDIRTNDGNMKETHGMLTVGLLNDRFHLEGPIVKDKLSYALSARGLHSIVLEPFMRMFLKNEYYNYYFYDLNGKLTWRVGDKDHLYLSIYQGADNGGSVRRKHYENLVYSEGPDDEKITFDTESRIHMNWGSTVGALRWNHIFNGKLFSNTTVSVNRYRMLMSVADKSQRTDSNATLKSFFNAAYKSGIRDYSLRTDFDWTPSPNHLVKFGAEYTWHDFRPQTAVVTEDDPKQKPLVFYGNNYTGHDLSLYMEDNISLGSHFTINPGLRLSWFNTQGQNYASLQPRFSARFKLDNGLAFKGGYSRMAQYVHLLCSTVISLPLDLWVPITKNIKPVTADHYSLGAYYDGLPGWEFSVEGYWKEMYNLMEYKEGTQFAYSASGWEPLVEMGRGRAMGLEFFVQKTSGKTTGWVSYTLSKSIRWFPDGTINQGNPFPYKYDRPHAFNVTLNHKFSEKVDVSLSWVFTSGSTMTIPLRYTTTVTPPRPGYNLEPEAQEAYYVKSRNNYRLPPSHRLNLGVNLRHRTRRGNEAVWNFSIYNAYNAMNPNFIFYGDVMEADDVEIDDPEAIPLGKLTILPILPAFSYTYNF